MISWGREYVPLQFVDPQPYRTTDYHNQDHFEDEDMFHSVSQTPFYWTILRKLIKLLLYVLQETVWNMLV